MGVLRALQGFQGTIGQPTAQVIDGSLKFESASSQYLSSTSTFQNTKSYEMTFSFWLKRCAPTAVKATQYIFSTNVNGTIFFDNDNSDQLAFNLRGSSGTNFFTYTSAKLRDYNAWYHVVVALNLGSGTQSQRFKCYINNVEQTMTNTSYPSNAYHTGGTWYIGSYGGSSHYPDYYLSNFYCISGQTLDPSYFGFTDPQTNTWRPKKYTGTFTFDNSFYLPLDNEDDFGKDKSGEGNHFTQNNFSGTSIDPDVVKDSPSGAVFGGRAQTGITTTSSAPANYCTFNPGNNINCTLSEGNLKFVTGGNNSTVWSTMPIPTSGKYCFESTFGGGDMALWLDQEARRENRNTHLTSTALGMFMYYNTGDSNNRFQTNSVSTAMDSSFTTDSSGDVYMFEVDMDAGTVRVRKDDGSDSGLYTMPDALKAAPLFIGFSVTTTWPAVTQTFNFGQKPFKNTPSQGFLPLNSATVRPNKVVPRPDQYVGIVTYSGDNSEYRLLSLNHQPDFTWFKERGNTRSHILSDTVTGITKHLSTDESGAQTSPSYPYVSSVDERGIVLRGGTSSGGNVSGRYYVAYSWKAGGNKNTFNVDDVGYATAAAAGLDGGSITPTGASVGTKQGFSLIKYTGTGSAATLPHGLTQAPEFVVVKNLDSNYNWAVYHKDLTSAAYYLFLNNSDGQSNNFYTFWNSTDPSSTVISLGADSSDSNVNTNKASQSHICYAWHSVPGLQKFGTYIGNGNSDGSYIELGFRPSLVIIKCLEGQNWILHDSVREPFNPVSLQLYPSISNAEYDFSGNAKDLLSNGFKLRGNNAGTNDSDGTTKYIYAAWAEAPASNLFGGQSNAR